jgi:uncharacterized membrane protein YjjB (DUF3815 family)
MEKDFISTWFQYLFWMLFGLLFGLLTGLGTNQLPLSLLIGGMFGLGLALLITRHTHKNGHLT